MTTRVGVSYKVELWRMLDKESLKILLNHWRAGRGICRASGFSAQVPGALRVAEVLASTSERSAGNYPYFHPLYAGQMLKPPHPVARLAYSLAQWINPNNHALDGGRATRRWRKEAVAGIAEMFGWPEHLGHLCVVARWPTWKRCGLRALAPGKKFWQASKLITHMAIQRSSSLPFAAALAIARAPWILRTCAKLCSR